MRDPLVCYHKSCSEDVHYLGLTKLNFLATKGQRNWSTNQSIHTDSAVLRTFIQFGHRSSVGIFPSVAWTCCPHPFQVALPQLEQSTFMHIVVYFFGFWFRAVKCLWHCVVQFMCSKVWLAKKRKVR
mmetsp:Transcript_63340/g.129052  ORF Transcript_63340/g.129052 Transcript_63340/m.129052 type:complete len:127 (+) Transcript_63340:310-690(+)